MCIGWQGLATQVGDVFGACSHVFLLALQSVTMVHFEVTVSLSLLSIGYFFRHIPDIFCLDNFISIAFGQYFSFATSAYRTRYFELWADMLQQAPVLHCGMSTQLVCRLPLARRFFHWMHSLQLLPKRLMPRCLICIYTAQTHHYMRRTCVES